LVGARAEMVHQGLVESDGFEKFETDDALLALFIDGLEPDHAALHAQIFSPATRGPDQALLADEEPLFGRDGAATTADLNEPAFPAGTGVAVRKREHGRAVTGQTAKAPTHPRQVRGRRGLLRRRRGGRVHSSLE